MPTFVAMNAQGEITDRWVGFDGPAAWGAAAEKARSDPRTLAAKQAAYDEKPTAALAECLASNAAADLDYKEAVKYYRAARNLDASQASFCSNQILSNMFYGSRDSSFTFDEIATEADLALALPGTTVDQVESLASMMTQLAKSADMPARAVPYLKAALATDIGDAEPSPTRQSLMVDYALMVEHDNEKAVRLRKDLLPENWEQDPDQLNSFAWWCFQNGVNLAEAGKLALQGVDLASEDKQRASILDTAAEISAARGHLDDAVALAKRAAALMPDEGYYQDQLKKFTAAGTQ